MKELLKQFRAYQKTTEFYQQLEERLYLEEAPENAPFPFAVFSFPYGFTGHDLEGKKEEKITIQLDLYAKKEAQFLELFDLAGQEFDRCRFEVPEQGICQFQRTGYRRIKEDGIKRYIIEFVLHIDKI